MATTVDTFIKNLKSADVIDYIFRLQGMPKDVRVEAKKFARENPEYRKELRSELKLLIRDRVDGRIRSEFGPDIGAIPVRNLKGETRKQVMSRRKEIAEELFKDVKAKGATSRAAAKGTFGPYHSISEELENLIETRAGEGPRKRMDDTSEMKGRKASRLENLATGTRGAIGAQMDRGGTSELLMQPRNPGERGDRVVISRDVVGERRFDVYDLDVEGNVVTDTRQRVSDLMRRRGDKSDLGPFDPKSRELDRFLSEKRQEVGGMGRMLSGEEIRKLPKKIREQLPETGDAEVYRREGGGIRVIARGDAPVVSTRKIPTLYEYAPYSPEEKASLAGDSKAHTHRKRVARGYQTGDEAGILEQLESQKATDVTDANDGRLKKLFVREMNEGRMPRSSNFRIFKPLNAPEGTFMVLTTPSEVVPVPGRKQAQKRTVIMETEGTSPEGVEGRTRSKTYRPQGRGAVGNVTQGRERINELLAESGEVVSGDPTEGGRKLPRTDRSPYVSGMMPGEVNMMMRRDMLKSIMEENEKAFENLTALSREERASEILAERVRSGKSLSPTEYIRKQIATLKKSSPSSGTRLAELEQTLENLRGLSNVEGGEIRRTLGVDPLDDLDRLGLEIDDVMDIAERRGGLPSSRSRAVSGFSSRTPRIPGPAGALLKIASLIGKTV